MGVRGAVPDMDVVPRAEVWVLRCVRRGDAVRLQDTQYCMSTLVGLKMSPLIFYSQFNAPALDIHAGIWGPESLEPPGMQTGAY